MLSTDEIADFEGLLKIAHDSLQEPTKLNSTILQLRVQTGKIIKLYSIDDYEIVGDLIQGCNLLIDRLKDIRTVKKNKDLLDFITTELIELQDNHKE